jgi:hypothetical protein
MEMEDAMAKRNSTTPRGRDADTREFIPADQAPKQARTTTDEKDDDAVTSDRPDENDGERRMLGKRHS